jgi:hypothetical protein
MPVQISDRSLRSSYSALSRRVGGQAARLEDLRGLLASVADRSGLTSTSARKQLEQAVSVQEQLAIVREGLSSKEKRDLEAILDHGHVKLADEARKFLEQLVGRAPVNPVSPANGPVQISAMRLVNGKVEIAGRAAPNVTVEAINLSTIPTKRLHDDNTFRLGTTDGAGKLSGRRIELSAGDWLRVRTRDAAGKASDWMVIRADQLGADTRGAEVALPRIDLTDAGGGKIHVANNNNSRPISEPFAKLQLTNERTGEKTVLELDDTGRFHGVPKINGRPGDSFSIAASDGRNNTSFKDKVGTLSVPAAGGAGGGAQIDDPGPHKDELKPDGTSRYALKRYSGPLVVGAIEPDDVLQGNIADCYLPAAAAALAHVRPDALRAIMSDDGNGKYTFTFKVRGRDKKVEVDADLYSRSSGGPLYGASRNSSDPKKMELWWPLFEKAYAKLHGDYHSIGNGGSSADVFEAVLGRRAYEDDFKPRNKDAVFRLMKDKLARKLPVAIGTKDDSRNAAIFANSGIYGDHAYSVLDAFERGGVKYVTVRNPWGESEPFPGDGKDDGTFTLKLDDMPKWFSVVWTVS